MRKLTTFVLMAILMLALASCGEGPEAIKFLDKKCPQETASTGILPQAGVVDLNLKPDSYVAVVPQRLRRGYTEQISISLFNGDRPAAGNVWVSLFDGGTAIQTVTAAVVGTANVMLPVPRLERSRYEVLVRVDDVPEVSRAFVDVVDGLLLFVETD